MGSPVEESAEGNEILCVSVLVGDGGGLCPFFPHSCAFWRSYSETSRIEPSPSRIYTSHHPLNQIVKCLRGNFSAAKLILEFLHPAHLGLGTSMVLAQHLWTCGGLLLLTQQLEQLRLTSPKSLPQDLFPTGSLLESVPG